MARHQKFHQKSRGRLQKKRRGVPPGYREVWGYRGVWDETKVKKGLWKFRFKATKKRGSKTYGSFGKGTKGAWKIQGVQRIVKTGKGQYQTVFTGTKKPIWFNVKNTRRRY